MLWSYLPLTIAHADVQNVGIKSAAAPHLACLEGRNELQHWLPWLRDHVDHEDMHFRYCDKSLRC